MLTRGLYLVEETAKTCMTTGFNLWCHLAALTYLRKSDNSYLKSNILPQLENGELCGGTGLSNAMKFYAGLDKLYLRAEASDRGYLLSGQLPMVSNLRPDHWFGVVSSAGDQKRIVAFVPCHSEGLRLNEKIGYLGLNGSATYTCDFDQVFIPEEWILSDHADEFIAKVRPLFVLYQIPLGFGVIESSIHSMRQVREKQGGCNQYLTVQPDDLEGKLQALKDQTYELAGASKWAEQLKDLLQLRLQTAYLTLQAVQASMLHHGGAGYIQSSGPSRRLREAYFFANLTPTIKHLEKMSAAL